MLKDITIGQYYTADSPIHSLDPRTKLIWTFFYIISLFTCPHPASYVIIALFLLIIIGISRVPVSFMIRGMRAVAAILIFTTAFNLFLTPGEAVITIGILKISREGIYTCISMLVRIALLITGSSLLTLTTTPNELTDGLERCLSFLKIFKVPVPELAMMMSIALRFIPILMEETDKIMKAQKARGADFESGSIFKRARNMIPLLVPLFISAFRRANDLAMAMEARCYSGGEGRTRMKPLSYRRSDYFSFILLFFYILIVMSAGLAFRFFIQPG